MRLLLDTHALIWWLYDYRRIPPRIHDLVVISATDVYVSAVSAWEIGVELRLGKLSFDEQFLAEFDAQVLALGFAPLSLTALHAVVGSGLPGLHKDPFDRLIVGQAIAERLAVVSADPQIAALGAEVVW